MYEIILMKMLTAIAALQTTYTLKRKLLRIKQPYQFQTKLLLSWLLQGYGTRIGRTVIENM